MNFTLIFKLKDEIIKRDQSELSNVFETEDEIIKKNQSELYNVNETERWNN